MESNTKSCLVVSYGPVPTPDNQTVEGGGMRAWGLAKGLVANSIDVTVAINEGFPQKRTEFERVKLVNWRLDDTFVQLINSFDAVVISYCMGDPSVFVAENINDNVQLILDAYVPIYIEVSARESKDIQNEYVNYSADVQRHNLALKRGDYFLYANANQEQLYKGVLSALSIINPASYRAKRLISTPLGIHRTAVKSTKNPYAELGIKKDDFVVLWFGGIYPWFRVDEYLSAIKTLSADKHIKFVFVGGKNPFNPNPDFSRQYDHAVDFAKTNGYINSSVFFVDWVDFNTRVDWFIHSDVIVSLNQEGEENKYSWRTRVMDFVWGESVIITNGGDPLSEELIAIKGAVRTDSLSAHALVKSVELVRKDKQILPAMKKAVRELKNKYYWDVATKELSQIITSGTLPYAEESSLRKLLLAANPLSEGSATATVQPSSGRIGTLLRLPFRVARQVKRKGIVRSAYIAKDIAKTQVKKRLDAQKREPQFVFISHPINNTGAPIVLLQIIEEYVYKYGANRVRVFAPGVEDTQRAYLRTLGVSVEQTVFGASFRFIRLQLGLRPHDFVLMNTAAVYDNYRDFVLLWLKTKRLKHAYWFIHEDIAQLPVIHREFLEQRNLHELSKAVKNKSLTLFFPSKRTALEYNELLDIETPEAIKLRVEVPDKYRQVRPASDFDSVRFLLSGTSSDGRKGQLLALSAFQYFVSTYYAKNPNKYRKFELHLVAIGETDYISQQIRWIAQSTLGEYVTAHPSLPKDDALEITHTCNAVICCSLNETFGLYVAEGMLMGHVVLRNNSAGMDEQLQDGKNGYFVDHTDIPAFAQKIELLLNKATTNTALATMGKNSQNIIDTYTKSSYISQIERANKA